MGDLSDNNNDENSDNDDNNANKTFSPAIGIFIREWFGLDIFLYIKELGLVWQFKLFQKDGNLPGVGSLQCDSTHQ